MKRWIAAALVLASAGTAAALPGDGMPEGKWWRFPRVARAIDLTDAQAARLEEVFEKRKPELIDLRADFQKKQFALQNLMDAASVDPAEASRRIDDVEKARARLAKARAMMFVEFRNVLTPDQWDRLRRIGGALQERRRERMLRRPGPGAER